MGQGQGGAGPAIETRLAGGRSRRGRAEPRAGKGEGQKQGRGRGRGRKRGGPGGGDRSGSGAEGGVEGAGPRAAMGRGINRGGAEGVRPGWAEIRAGPRALIGAGLEAERGLDGVGTDTRRFAAGVWVGVYSLKMMSMPRMKRIPAMMRPPIRRDW